MCIYDFLMNFFGPYFNLWFFLWLFYDFLFFLEILMKSKEKPKEII